MGRCIWMLRPLANTATSVSNLKEYNMFIGQLDQAKIEEPTLINTLAIISTFCLLTFMGPSTKANTCFHLLYNCQQWCQAPSTTQLAATLNIFFEHSLCTWQNKIKVKGFKCFLISFNLPECKFLQFQWRIQFIHNVVVVAKTMVRFLFQFLVIKILF